MIFIKVDEAPAERWGLFLFWTSFVQIQQEECGIINCRKRIKRMISMKDIIKGLAKKALYSTAFWIMIIVVIIIVVLYALGFRITYAPELDNNWDAIGSMGEWAGALVGVLIPIAAIYVQYELEKSKKAIGYELEKNKKDIGESNVDLMAEIELLRKLMDVDKVRSESLKEKVLKFVNISMITKTSDVAKHLGISEEEAFIVLEELLRHDGTISAEGQVRKENMDNIVWTKKRR